MMKNGVRTSMNWLLDRHICCFFSSIALCLAALHLLGAKESFGKSYSFAWSANPEPVTGYKLYYKKGDVAVQNFVGTGAIEGSSMIDVGPKNTFTTSGLDESAIYYFALRAYNETDESENSFIITTQPTNSSSNLAPQAIAGKLNSQRSTVSTPKGFTIATTTSITQYGITWAFAEPVVSGQFVKGDHWVVAPESWVKIVAPSSHA